MNCLDKIWKKTFLLFCKFTDLGSLMREWGGPHGGAAEMEEKKMQQYAMEEKKGEVLVDDEGAATVEVQEGEETETYASENTNL